jgi:YHS domain-containing protein
MKLPNILDLFRTSENAIDPVCNMEVLKTNPKGGSFLHQEKTYYFCSPRCRSLFQDDPEPFLSKSETNRQPGSQLSEDNPSKLEFTVDISEKDSNIVYVEYMCPCGCEPGARYELESETSGWEHCCCGRVHFAGKNSKTEIVEYLEERAKTAMDQDVEPYVFESTEVVTPSGQAIPVSYAQPVKPRK